jgi:hypothetical protein
VLAVYRLIARFAAAGDSDALAGRIRLLDEVLRSVDEEVEGRLSRGLAQLQNARDALRDGLAKARRLSSGLVREEDSRLTPAETSR